MSKRKYKIDVESKLLRKIKKALPHSMIYDINIDIKEVMDSKYTNEKKIKNLKDIIDELNELDDIANDYYEATKSENKRKKITLFKNYNKDRINLVNEAISQVGQPAKVKKCPPGKIENPKTGRCINANGAIAKKLGLGKIQLQVTKPDKILNPKTGRYVNANGKIGKKILLEQKKKSSVAIVSPKPQTPPPPPKPQTPLPPPKPQSSFQCSDIVTIPQFIGTCWFNAILMSLLYSQDSRKLLLHNNIYKTNKDKQELYTIINDILVDHYVGREKGMKYFEKLKPEVILKDYILSTMSLDKIQNILTKGWMFDIFLPKFINIIGKTCLTLDEYKGEFYINVVKSINIDITLKSDNTFNKYDVKLDKNLLDVKDIPDYLFVNLNKVKNELFDVYFSLLKKEIKNLNKIRVKKDQFKGLGNLKEYITYNGNTYKLDSIILSNYNNYERGNHAIAGISCKDKRYVYNGWMRTTDDPNIKPDEKLFKNDLMPNELMNFNWDVNDPNNKICLKDYNIKALSKTTESNLCFSFGKGQRTLIYVKVLSQLSQPPPKPQTPQPPPKPQTPQPPPKSSSKSSSSSSSIPSFAPISPSSIRISANIQDRINYYNALFKILSTITYKQCLEFRNTTNGHKTYTIGDSKQIEVSRQIGTASKYGVIYLSNIKDKEKYKFAIKIMKKIKGNLDEIKILEKLSAMTLKKVTPHFPILYKTFECSFPHTGDNYPKLIQKGTHLIVLNELADGDLATILFEPNFHSSFEIIKNTLQQIYISILTFHLYTNKIHADCHYGNFLYHKIKAGGYIHYKIYDVDVYIKNLGYLWIIWDYGLAKRQTYENSYVDYDRIICAFINNTPKRRYGWIQTTEFIYSDQIANFVEDVNVCLRVLDQEKYLWIDKLLKTKLFSKELIKPPDNEIINLGHPYILK